MTCRYRTGDGRSVIRTDAMAPLALVDSVERFFEQVAVTNLLWYYPTYGNDLRERSLICFKRDCKHDCKQTQRLKPNYS